MYTNANTNVIKINTLVDFNDNKYVTKKMEHTNNTTNNITRHNRNNYEHNVIKQVYKHINVTNNYDTEQIAIIRNHQIQRYIITFTMVLSVLE